MPRTTDARRLRRLDLLAARLKSDEPMILRELAAELGVSLRTIHRDVELLRERGLPIEADRGRGGGVRLHWRWGIGRIALSYREAVDLLVSLAVAEQMRSPILMANLAPIRRKLMASFSPADQQKIKGLKGRIRLAEPASPALRTGYATPPPGIVERLHEAFLLLRAARIRYVDEKGAETERIIEPHHLLLAAPICYAMSWDRLRGDVRSFRCDRIRSIEVLDEDFAPRPFADFEAPLEGMDLILP